MGYLDNDIQPAKESSAILREMKKFTSETMRPAGIELDKAADPADVSAQGSQIQKAPPFLEGLFCGNIGGRRC